MGNIGKSMIYFGGNVLHIYEEYHLTNLKEFSPQIISLQWLDIMKRSQKHELRKKQPLKDFICHPYISFAEVSV